MKWFKLLGVLTVITAAVVLPTQAAVFTLTDLNSVFSIDSAVGANQWMVEGTSQLFEQGFWFRVGEQSGESRLGSFYSNGWVDPSGRIATMQYQHSSFTAEVIYVLTGGTPGSGTSDVAETIRIINTGRTSLSMHFFQYCDFDLGGTPGDDQLQFPNANTVSQSDGGGVSLSETVVTPVSSHHEGDLYASTKNRLDDAYPTTLSDLPAYGGGSLTGDVTWAFQWDRSIPHGGTLLISKDKRLSTVPEPGTLLLLGLGLVGATVAKRRSKKG
jgi:hypothetical protein